MAAPSKTVKVKKNLAPYELGWVAGLLEGEGSFYAQSPQPRKDGRRYRYPHISCHLTDRDVLEHLRQVTGVGQLRPEAHRSPLSKKASFVWVVSKHREAVALMNKLVLLMGQRRQSKIRELLIGMQIQRGWVRHGNYS